MKAGAVLYVKDLDRMSEFYLQCFGFEMVEATADFDILESEDWMLSLVVTPGEIAATIVGGARRRHNTPIKLAFEVARIERVREMAPGLGGQIDGKDTEWDFRGYRHCDGVDPEGNVIQLLEGRPTGEAP